MPRQIKIGSKDLPKPRAEPGELRYVTDEDLVPVRKIKWKQPSLPLERLIMGAVHRKQYQVPQEKTLVKLIVKAAVSLESGIVSNYPTEWIEECCDWARKKWQAGQMVQLAGLLSLIQNRDRMLEFAQKWQHKHGDIPLQLKEESNGGESQ